MTHTSFARAVRDSFVKLDPRTQVQNPVMFLVYVAALVTSGLFIAALFGVKDAPVMFTAAIALILWFTVLFANFAEAITRIENGTMDLSVQPELIDEVFREALAHLDRHASEHDIKVKLADDMLMADMDVRLIVQVIINLLNNAIKYTPQGSHITLQARKIGRNVRIMVADDGPGVSEEDKKRLFEMFFTGGTRGRSSDSGRGLGLGLSLCESIVEAHGSSIKVRNVAPHGVSFEFSLKASKR